MMCVGVSVYACVCDVCVYVCVCMMCVGVSVYACVCLFDVCVSSI